MSALPVLADHDRLSEGPYVATPLCIPEVFSADECDRALALAADNWHYRLAQRLPVEGTRSALTLWLDVRQPEVAFVVERFSLLVERVNRFYGFEISGYRDPLLLCQYRAGDGFEWHVDAAERTTSTRKLSLSIQLSESGDYEGGALEFMPGGEIPFARDRGTAIVFPSYLCHRLSRVTRGVRSALVGWAHGPTFR